MTQYGQSGVPRPLLVDTFCCAGGAGMGYHRAGFDVIGVDKKPQPRYPFEFVQGDALEFLDEVIAAGRTYRGRPVAAAHGSPPCQHFSSMTIVTGRREDHPDLLEPTRERLRALGVPYVIENAERAPLLNPVRCCGVAFGLTMVEDDQRYVLRRHRLFECSFPVMVPGCACHKGAGKVLGLYGGGTRQASRRLAASYNGGCTDKANAAQGRVLMDMPWATRYELTQAIPPAYTEHIGGYLMAAVERDNAAVAA